MASIQITCYSRTGKTKLLAEAIGRGAAEVPGIKVDVLASPIGTGRKARVRLRRFLASKWMCLPSTV